jgi:putative ABC transport system ATP-binding protein
VIWLNQVSKLYPAKAGAEGGVIRALDEFTLRVEAGEWIAVMGPSGSGKSTLVNLIGCLDRPSSGEIWLEGEKVSELAAVELPRLRSEKIGFVFQQFHLIPYLTAVENVMLAQYFHSMTDEREARQALARVGLADRAEHLPAQLSGGEQQRVAVARALVTDPPLLVADEPTGNLDSETGAALMDLLLDIRSRLGTTILVATHNEVVAAHADRVLRLHDGELVKP